MKNIIALTLFFAFSCLIYPSTVSMMENYDVKLLVTIDKKPVWFNNSLNLVYFKSGLKIDADGAPNAYHPNDIGIDHLANAKSRNGNWVGIVTVDGEPAIQGRHDPYPGYYVSTTSLYHRSRRITDPKRYVNSSTIPYFVLPKPVMKASNIKLGDLGIVVNYDNHYAYYAIFADVGPSQNLGEGSIDLANRLEIPSNPKTGGKGDNVYTFVFPGSGKESPLSLDEIQKRAKSELKKIGGLKTLQMIIAKSPSWN